MFNPLRTSILSHVFRQLYFLLLQEYLFTKKKKEKKKSVNTRWNSCVFALKPHLRQPLTKALFNSMPSHICQMFFSQPSAYAASWWWIVSKSKANTVIGRCCWKEGKVWAASSWHSHPEKLIRKLQRAGLAWGLMNNLNVDDDSAPVAVFVKYIRQNTI